MDHLGSRRAGSPGGQGEKRKKKRGPAVSLDQQKRQEGILCIELYILRRWAGRGGGWEVNAASLGWRIHIMGKLSFREGKVASKDTPTG